MAPFLLPDDSHFVNIVKKLVSKIKGHNVYDIKNKDCNNSDSDDAKDDSITEE